MKINLRYKVFKLNQVRHLMALFVLLILISLNNNTLKAQGSETFSAGTYIINMGVTPQTESNGLKPYGMMYDLIKNYSVPIKWVINPAKVKDGIDFTFNSVNYRGGTFIIPQQFITPAVQTRITFWIGQGVVANLTAASLTVNVTYTLSSAPRWILNNENTAIAEDIFANAGITDAASYPVKAPSALGNCDDIYVMPHADPTWANHKNLYYWNLTYNGALWAGCHAVSVLENLSGPDIVDPMITRRLNFLMSDGPTPSQNAVPFGSHNDGTPPYTLQSPTHPIMQFMGITDGAHQNGSEQIYLPHKLGTGWRPSTTIGSFDPTHSNVPTLSNGPAAAIAFGRGFGDPSRGWVMYEGGHDIAKQKFPDNIAAQRAFFNFSFLSAQDRQPIVTPVATVPSLITSGQTFTISATSVSPVGSGNFTYLWTSTCGGTFANATAASTTFTAPIITNTTPCNILLRVTDDCGRITFVNQTTVVIGDADRDGIADINDIDDDNDGILDVVEVCGVGATNFSCASSDPAGDADLDGIPNWKDANFGALNANGCVATLDTDGDGIANFLDLDSDNDGIADVIESFGVDANGDGRIDNFTDANTNGLSDNVASCANALNNPSFEATVQPSIGDNLTGSGNLGLWSMETGGTFNVVRTNGSVYAGGPNNAQNGTHYVDITNLSDYIQQTVNITGTATVNFGGYFSSREQSGGYVNWTGRVEILNAAGTILATSSTRNFTNADGVEDQIWYYLSGATTLTAGSYIFRVYVGSFGNFDNANLTACYGSLAPMDTDGDGVPNYLDRDSDNDGIPDVIEAGGTDANNDGIIDSFTDTDGDGFSNNVDGDVGYDGIAENTANVLIISGADTNGDGRADSWPRRNLDLIGYPNPYDLDSDGDGILDLIEAGFAGTNGIASGTLGTDGWSNTIDALAALNLLNSDNNGNPNYIDIDSDNDGITDNVEAQSTSGYKVPTDVDIDGDGINDEYETAPQIGVYGGGGVTLFDKDGDTTPDYRDTDTDNDGVPDRNEGDRNNPFRTITQVTIDASGDTDGDGLMNVFDNTAITSLTSANYFKNVTMGNMGVGSGFTDNFDGPIPSGSLIGLQKSDPSNTVDRDWRNASILPLHINNFSVNYVAPTANIKWDVENELQTNYYEVENSTDGNTFAPINRVNAKNSNKASYIAFHNIANINSAIFYYRVKQTDKDGKIYYTQTGVIRINKTLTLTEYPNPFTSFVNCSFSSNVNEKGVIEILTPEGRIVASQSINVLKGNNNIQINSLGRLTQGNYLLRLQTPTNTASYRLIKN